ncbi:unnamed protein product [Ostreobium quekettii]|uniref:5'-3' exoribonuclease n=1 Tax=Ostreobium quekettii TaxID=121088 RepID=A0A8S1ISP6_9CHLO|nr:unnamed protein product [Ostreobium quekettii]|eukprot:evm.model.scf_668EXC.10 EVM.evm.TU.scf_668EXC.10   scf_668EXC:60731-71503(-)
MGVPAFYRWLSNRYPKIVRDVIDEEPVDLDGQKIPVDLTKPCKNGEWDNLYLDMNGIIHPCFHPEDREAPTTEEEVFQLIFEYIDHVFSLIRPRKLLFMAIDGVAPRAKMNQQRSRRFKSVKESEDKAKEEEKLREEFAAMGLKVPQKKEKSGQLFDSNVITPGTAFMARLSVALQYYIHLRQNTSPAWKDLLVILSDANTPGEGEHKIVSYIREQRGRKGWDPNTRHVLYGLDADLIMLALATHEPHFAILREVVFMPQKTDPRDNLTAAFGTPDPGNKPSIAKKPYQLLFIHILRAYLNLELHRDDLPFEWDEERVLDDFVFLCFFVGNDFLPHSPTLEIREGGIDLLMRRYRENLPRLGGFLCNGSKVNLQRVEMLVQEVAKEEEDIFRARMKRLKDQKDSKERQRKRLRTDQSLSSVSTLGTRSPASALASTSSMPHPRHAFSNSPSSASPTIPGLSSHSQSENNTKNKAVADQLREQLRGGISKRQRVDSSADSKGDGASTPASANHEDMWKNMESIGKQDDKNPFKLPAETMPGQADSEKMADVQQEFNSKISSIMKEKADKFDEMMEHDMSMALGEEGYKDRYYKSKYPNHTNLQEVKDGMVRAYVEGLCWVMGYYYDGVPSWRWYYPYHYAPFTSDLCQMSHIEPHFELSKPFDPIQQLMSVLPSGSRHSLPEPLQDLFVSDDSPIKDFYPLDFKQDMNGKRFQWQAVALLPFIDEDRLVSAMEPHMDKLTPEEKDRNTTKLQQLYFHSAHAMAPAVHEMAHNQRDVPFDQRLENKQAIDPREAKGINGFICLPAGDYSPAVIHAPFKPGEDITANQVVCVMYILPPHQEHEARVLEGTNVPECNVDVRDIPPQNPLWHEKMRQHTRPRDAPRLGDAARRHIHHNMDRRSIRPSAPSPTGFPNAATMDPAHIGNGQHAYGSNYALLQNVVNPGAVMGQQYQHQNQMWGYGQTPQIAPHFQQRVGIPGSLNVASIPQNMQPYNTQSFPQVMVGGQAAINPGLQNGIYLGGGQYLGAVPRTSYVDGLHDGRALINGTGGNYGMNEGFQQNYTGGNRRREGGRHHNGSRRSWNADRNPGSRRGGHGRGRY